MLQGRDTFFVRKSKQHFASAVKNNMVLKQNTFDLLEIVSKFCFQC